MIVFDPTEHPPVKAQGMLSQVIGPRPIAMISTVGADGCVNVAPFSYFMPVTGSPLTIAVAIGQRGVRGEKDTYVNLRRTGDFVINVTSDHMRDHIETAAMEFPPDASEADFIGWHATPSQYVESPSIAESPVHVECRFERTIEVGDQREPSGGVHLVLATIVCIALDESVCGPDLRVDVARLGLVGRLGFPWFSRAIEPAMFALSRVSYAEHVATGARSEVIS